MVLRTDIRKNRWFVRFGIRALLAGAGLTVIVTTILWGRSYWRADAITYTAPGWLIGAGLENGNCDILFSAFPSGSGGCWTGSLGFQHGTGQSSRGTRGKRWIPYPRKFDCWGLSYGSGTMPIPSAPASWVRPWYWVISIPPWYVDLVAALPLLCWLCKQRWPM
jgi:hypothetical protein